MRKFMMLGLTALLVVGCLPRVPPQEWVIETHNTSEAFLPPPIYRVWWTEIVRDCGCTPAVTFEQIDFYRLPGNTFPCVYRGACYGAFVPGVNAIFIAAVHEFNARTVKHEFLHAVLGVPGHPPIFHQLGLYDVTIGDE